MSLRRLLAPLLLAAFALPACVAADPPRPLLWKVSDGDNHIYLLGSFHMLRAGDYPLAGSTEAAYADAERVVFELSPAESMSPDLATKMFAAGRRSDGGTLQASLPPDLWAELEAQLRVSGQMSDSMQDYDAWFVGLMLAVQEMGRLGLDPSKGLDRHFSERAVAAGKPTIGLETGDQQIALFDGMTPAQQIASLEDSLGEVGEMRARIERLHSLWRSGDAAGLEQATVAELEAEHPQLYARLNRDRNRAWLPPLRRLLDDSHDDDALVVVGAMHLLGEDGVVELLREAGYTVERVDG